MRITFVLPGTTSRPIGGFTVVYEYANRLAHRQHTVTIVHTPVRPWVPTPQTSFRQLRGLCRRSLDQVVFWHSQLTRSGVRWHKFASGVNLMYARNCSGHEFPQADVTVATGWQTVGAVCDANENGGVRFYLVQHYETWCGSKEEVDATWRQPIKKIVVSKWLFEKGLELGVPPSEMTRIPVAIDHDRFKIMRPLQSRPHRIAMMYSPLQWKGGADGLSTLEIAKSQFPQLSAVLFGIGPKPRSLPAWVEYVQDPSQALLTDHIYNGSSIYLCPSWTEGFCLPGAEAQACGCALVSTDNLGVREYAVDGETALLTPVCDPTEAANQIVRLLTNEELRLNLAIAGRDRVRHLSWNSSTEALDQLFHDHTAAKLSRIDSFDAATLHHSAAS